MRSCSSHASGSFVANTFSKKTLGNRLPAGTYVEQFIAINLSPVDDVPLAPNDEVIDQVSLGNNSPAVNPKVVPVDQQDEEAVPVPPPPDTDQQDRPQRDLRRVNYWSVHEHGREGEDAWSQSRQEGDWKEDTEEDIQEETQEEMEDTEDRGAPE